MLGTNLLLARRGTSSLEWALKQVPQALEHCGHNASCAAQLKGPHEEDGVTAWLHTPLSQAHPLPTQYNVGCISP